MNQETFLLIADVSTGTALAATIIGLARFGSLLPKMKLLLILTGVSFICDLGPLYHNELNIPVNYFSDVFRLAEFVLLLMIYYQAFETKNMFKVFLLIGLLYFLFLAFNVMFIQREKINSYTNIVSASVFIVLAVLFFYKLMKDLPTLEVYRLPMFWVNVAVLVYFAGNLFLFVVSHYIVTVLNVNFRIYWSFHNFLSISKNILFAVGFYVSGRPSKKPL